MLTRRHVLLYALLVAFAPAAYAQLQTFPKAELTIGSGAGPCRHRAEWRDRRPARHQTGRPGHLSDFRRRILSHKRPAPGARSGAEGLFGGGAFLLCGLCDTREHRGGVAVQDLVARVLADVCFGERLPGPVAPKFGAIGTADDALGAVQPDGRLDGPRPERVAIHVHLRLPEARRGQLLVRCVE